MPDLIPVILESPFAGDVEMNLCYLRACMRDCLLNHGEAPFASHGLYTQDGVLDDTLPDERDLGIAAGFVWGRLGEVKRRVFYTDLGMTTGMKHGLAEATMLGQEVVYRDLPGWIADVRDSQPSSQTD